MVGIVLWKHLHVLLYLIFITTLWGKYYYYPHLMDKEIEMQEGSNNLIKIM